MHTNTRGERVVLRLRRHGTLYGTAIIVGTGRAQRAHLHLLRRLVPGSYQLEAFGPRGTQTVSLPIILA